MPDKVTETRLVGATITDRRSALMLTGAAAITLALDLSTQNRAMAQAPLKRRNIDDLSAQELKNYEDAIAILMQRSDADPKHLKGYQYQADLHNASRTHPDTTVGACEHASEEFLPWHRAHLSIFEKLLQEIDPTVTIPYWDWTKKPSGQRIPVAFERAASPLFHTGRFPSAVSPVEWDSDEIKAFVAEQDWTLFAGRSKAAGASTGQLEDEPHNALHPFIGPTMGSQATAAEDPVYWSFHAYIDLVWSRWQKKHSDSFQCGNCTLWLEPASFTVAQTARTEDFGYVYDYDFSIDDSPSGSAVVLVAGDLLGLTIKDVGPRTLSAEGADADTQIRSSLAKEKRIFAKLTGVQAFKDLSYSLNVYLHPKGVRFDNLTADQQSEYLVRTKTIWRSHHGGELTKPAYGDHAAMGRFDIFVELSQALGAYDGNDWTISVRAESLPNEQPGTDAYKAAKEREDSAIVTLSNLVQAVEIEER